MTKRDLTNMNLNIYQPDLITNMTQVYYEDLKSLMTFNTPATPHRGIFPNQETYTKISVKSSLPSLQILSLLSPFIPRMLFNHECQQSHRTTNSRR